MESTSGKSNKKAHGSYIHAAAGSYLFPALLAAAYLLGVLLSNPVGEFPIGDDFIYNGAVRDTLASGTIKLNWSAQACYLHILLGAIICKLFGVSYLALRINNMFWTLFGTLGLWLAFRAVGLNAAMSTGFAAIFLFNPIIYWLSFTFMTDPMSLGLSNWFIYLTLLSLRKRALPALCLGTIALMISLAARLFAAVYALPAVLAALLNWRQSKSWWATFALSVFGPVLVALGLPALFRLTDPSSASVSLATMGIDISNFAILLAHHPLPTLWRILVAFGQLSIYIAFFCLPVILALIGRHLQLNPSIPRVAWLSASTVITATIATLVGHNEKLMPFNSNVLYPPWTCITAVVGFPSSWYHEVWAGITAFGSILGFAFIAAAAEFTWTTSLSVLKNCRIKPSDRVRSSCRQCFTVACLLVSCGFVSLVIVAHDNDRYYSMALAPALLTMAFVWRKYRPGGTVGRVIFAVSTLSIYLYSVASIHDSMGAFRARWNAIEDLQKAGISPRRIDGGWEFEMMNSPELIKTMHPVPGGWKIAESNRGTEPLNKVRWWPVVSDEYVISQKEYAGYEVLRRYPYSNWVWRPAREILVLKKIANAQKLSN